MIRERMGQLLLEAQLVSEEQIHEALRVQQVSGDRLGSILVEMKAVSESTLLQFLSQQYGVPTVDLSACEIEEDLLTLIPYELAEKNLIVPVRKTNSRLNLAMIDPSNVALIDEIKFRTGLHIVPVVAMESDILATIHRIYRQDSSSPRGGLVGNLSLNSDSKVLKHQEAREGRIPPIRSSSVIESGDSPGFEDLQEWLKDAILSFPQGVESVTGHDLKEDKAPIVNLVNGLLRRACEMGASDIHVEPYEMFIRVRFRLDGVLRPVMHVPRNLRQAMIARIKIMSNLDIAERRLPQDGRMNLKISPSGNMDVRVSILPCLHGEKAVLRLLDRSSLSLDIRKVGFDKSNLETVLSTLENPYGMILVTGPTGSGKTTTLYSALQFLNSSTVNIVTVEDPIEYHLTGINQLQTKDDIGLTFATGLRSFLRQDPEILMIGEIRDRETAQIAIQAALTGHRVLSTLHTNDAPRAITRLLDMGIEPFLVSSSLSLIIAQRLVRKICHQCIEPDHLPLASLTLLGFSTQEAESIVPMRGRGCSACHDTGFRGRVALFEVLRLSEELHEKILYRVPANELKACALRSGYKSLRHSGLMAIKNGVTSVDEVVGATTADFPS